jgi:hypothetical protein
LTALDDFDKARRPRRRVRLGKRHQFLRCVEQASARSAPPEKGPNLKSQIANDIKSPNPKQPKSPSAISVLMFCLH